MTILLSPSLTERRGVSLPMMSQPGGFGSIRFFLLNGCHQKWEKSDVAQPHAKARQKLAHEDHPGDHRGCLHLLLRVDGRESEGGADRHDRRQTDRLRGFSEGIPESAGHVSTAPGSGVDGRGDQNAEPQTAGAGQPDQPVGDCKEGGGDEDPSDRRGCQGGDFSLSRVSEKRGFRRKNLSANPQDKQNVSGRVRRSPEENVDYTQGGGSDPGRGEGVGTGNSRPLRDAERENQCSFRSDFPSSCYCPSQACPGRSGGFCKGTRRAVSCPRTGSAQILEVHGGGLRPKCADIRCGDQRLL